MIWFLTLICCGRFHEGSPAVFVTWDEAEAFRESYLDAGGHDRVAILRAVQEADK